MLFIGARSWRDILSIFKPRPQRYTLKPKRAIQWIMISARSGRLIVIAKQRVALLGRKAILYSHLRCLSGDFGNEWLFAWCILVGSWYNVWLIG
jgi:hypothetical protein